MLRKLANDERGGVAILAGIALPALALAAGFAVDHSTLIRTYSDLQNTADAAALAGARQMWTRVEDGREDGEAAGETMAANVIETRRPEARYSVSASEADATVEVSMSTDQRLMFGGLFGSQERTVSVGATAIYTVEMRSGCMIALDDAAGVGIDMQGSAKVNAPDCGIWSNATGSDAIHMQGAPSLEGREVCGDGASGNAAGRISPELTTDCGKAPDPYEGRLSNVPDSCTHTDFKFPKHAKTATLSPGVYCGGLDIESIDVTLQPGLYVIKNGPLFMKGNASLTGAGVALVLTGQDAALEMQGSPEISLSAMMDGDFAGIAIAVTDTGDEAATSELQGSPDLSVTGSIYMPGQSLDMQGSPRVELSGDDDKLVASSFDLQGSPDIVINADDTQLDIADIDYLRISH